VAQGFQTVQGNYYGTQTGNVLQHTPENAGLQGLSNVMELLVQKYMNANDGDETYVRVKAAKEFYIYPTQVIQPDHRSVGARDQREDENGATGSGTPAPSPSSDVIPHLTEQIMQLERQLQQQPQQNEQTKHIHY
jgi:hypothetical protein